MTARGRQKYLSGARFRYINFNANNDRDWLLKYERGWKDTLTLINNAINALDQGTADSVFDHYFPQPPNGVDGKHVAKQVYQKMQSQLQQSKSPANNIWIENEDLAGGCTLDGDSPPDFCYTYNVEGPGSETYNYLNGILGLTDAREGDLLIHCCMEEMTEWMRNLDQVDCDALKNQVSLKMDTLVNTLIHEFTCVMPRCLVRKTPLLTSE